MNKEEMEQTIKGLQENQETAIKLLEENVELKQRIQKAIDYIKNCDWNDWDNGAEFTIVNILQGGNN